MIRSKIIIRVGTTGLEFFRIHSQLSRNDSRKSHKLSLSKTFAIPTHREVYLLHLLVSHSWFSNLTQGTTWAQPALRQHHWNFIFFANILWHHLEDLTPTKDELFYSPHPVVYFDGGGVLCYREDATTNWCHLRFDRPLVRKGCGSTSDWKLIYFNPPLPSIFPICQWWWLYRETTQIVSCRSVALWERRRTGCLWALLTSARNQEWIGK